MDERATRVAGPLACPSDPPAGATTVRLATAAHALGICQAAARDLAERGEFPCTVIKTSDGYRVPFAALLRILRSTHGKRTGPASGKGTPADDKDQER